MAEVPERFSLADTALLLERLPPDKPFEVVLDQCVDPLVKCLRNVNDCRSASRSDPVRILRTLTVRYARYVRETFGTRLSPHLSRAFANAVARKDPQGEHTGCPSSEAQTETTCDAGRPYGNEGSYDREAEVHARFIARAVALAIVLSAGLQPEDVAGRGEWSGFFGPWCAEWSDGLGMRPASSPWAVLWIELTVIDLIGCGSLQHLILRHPAFESELQTLLRDDVKLNDVFGHLTEEISHLHSSFYPPRDPGGRGREAWLPALSDPPWLGCDPDERAAESNSDMRSAEDDALRSRQNAIEPQYWLEHLAATWLYVLVSLDVELLRHRHLLCEKKSEFEATSSSCVRSELGRLWRLTAQTMRGWMWARRNAVPNASGRERVRLMRNVLTGRPFSWSTEEYVAGQGDGFEECVSTSAPLFRLSIDSLWLQMYLSEAITRQMDLTEVMQEHFPDRYLSVVFLKRFSALVIHLLWSLMREESGISEVLLPDFPAETFGASRSQRSGPEHRAPKKKGDAPPGGDKGVAGACEPGEAPLAFGRGVAPIGIEEYTDALIEMVDVYAHNVVVLPFEIHVGRFLRWFLKSQGPLFLMKPYYRDHVYHVIDVFLLGDFLLGCRLGRERSRVRDILETLLERVCTGPKGKDDEAPPPSAIPDLRKNWCVAGLFHDLGYPILLRREMTGGEPESLVGETLQGFVHQVRKAFHGGDEQLAQRIREAFTSLDEHDPGVTRDHGVLSALMIRDHMRKIQWAASERHLVELFEPALTAIYLHNLQDRVVRIEDAPLTYLLAFCDEVQDWGRRRVPPEGLSRDVTWAVTDPANWQLRSTPVLGDLRLVVEGVAGYDVVLPGPRGETVSLPGRGTGAASDAARDEVRIQLYQVYRPTSPELLDPLFLWISKAQNLERLDARNVPWWPVLVLVTGVPRNLRRMELTYLEVLTRIAARAEELNLRRFVHHLIRRRREFQRGVVADAPAARGHTAVAPLKGLGSEWDWVVLDQRRLAEEVPLRSFGTTAGAGRLVEMEEQILREAAERYRYQARTLWPLAEEGEADG